ncbi:MAG: DUF2306 domain-containing protein [Thermoanaerobaculia bacterium]
MATRARHALFTVLGLMVLFVAWNNERFFLNPQAPEWGHLNPIRWHLLPHGLGGALALGLGALQFSTRLRRRHLRIHRLSGRLYIVGTFVAAPVAIVMAFINSPWFLIPFTVVQAGTWMLFTLVAYLCIRRGEVSAHREWMMRSYAIVLIFLEGRLLMAIPALGRRGMDAVVLVNWGCLAVTLVVVECLLRWRQIVPNKALHPTTAGVDERPRVSAER